MAVSRTLLLALLLAGWLHPALFAQDSGSDAVSSDDIRVADGLQLPEYGHAWILDTWHGVKELVEMHPSSSLDRGVSLKFHKVVELQGEAAAVRSHDTAPQIFLRRTGPGGNMVHAEFAAVHLTVLNDRRQASKDSPGALAAIAKGRPNTSADVIALTMEQVGATNWYRFSLPRPLDPGEYALVALPGTPAAELDESYDFAIDPAAPENRQPIRSEENHSSAP